MSRNGKRLDGTHADVAAALPPAPHAHSDCVLDGELCAFDADGVPRFELFQRGEGSIAYVVFDLLELDGEPLIAEPWSRRRELLTELIVPGPRSSSSRRSSTTARRCSRAAHERGLEGVMAKRRASPLPAGPPQRRLAQDQAAQREPRC